MSTKQDTFADIAARHADQIAADAARLSHDMEAPTIRLTDLAALMDGQERIETRLDHLAALAVATDRLVNAVRALRDADGSKFRAIQKAEIAMLDALTDYEAFIEGDEDAVALFHRLSRGE